jgi:hypothetical protein
METNRGGVSSPWLRIPLAEYEGHMALPSIGQAQMLADRFSSLVTRCHPPLRTGRLMLRAPPLIPPTQSGIRPQF